MTHKERAEAKILGKIMCWDRIGRISEAFIERRISVYWSLAEVAVALA